MSEDNKVKGPASYFPAIEKKYGQPIEHWLNLLAGITDETQRRQLQHRLSELLS